MYDTGKEFSEFAVGLTRVRVISDCTADINAVIEAEKRVVDHFKEYNLWQHEAVTLFILENLSPLVGQLRQLHGLDDQNALQLPLRPMVNLYDLAHPQECFVFVNKQVMVAEGYWGDTLAIEGILAHEHAHPAAECAAIEAARGLKLAVKGPASITELLTQLAETVSTGAVSELMANDLCISHGFHTALHHVDRLILKRAAGNLTQRPELVRRLSSAVTTGAMSTQDEKLLLVLADAQATLPFALELAPFFHSGYVTQGAEMEETLRSMIFPHLEPAIEAMFFALRDLFLSPAPNWDLFRLKSWCGEILTLLSRFFSQWGADISFHLQEATAPPQTKRMS